MEKVTASAKWFTGRAMANYFTCATVSRLHLVPEHATWSLTSLLNHTAQCSDEQLMAEFIDPNSMLDQPEGSGSGPPTDAGSPQCLPECLLLLSSKYQQIPSTSAMQRSRHASVLSLAMLLTCSRRLEIRKWHQQTKRKTRNQLRSRAGFTPKNWQIR